MSRHVLLNEDALGGALFALSLLLETVEDADELSKHCSGWGSLFSRRTSLDITIK